MQVEKKSLSTAKSAKDYLSKNEIPQLFECLMTGLMYHRPPDHIAYLQECLERIKKQGVNGVRWDMFLEAKKTALPPIDSVPREDYRPEPLPDIGDLQLRIAIDASIVVVQAGPGMDKKAICKNLGYSFPSYVSIDLGTCLKERARQEELDPESRWKAVKSMINEGELAPDEFVREILIKELNKYSEKKHFIIDGYPRTTKEREDFERFIGFNRVKFMLLVDCEEDVCQQKLMERGAVEGWADHNPVAINKRIVNYKMNTLAVCKYFDDQDKLRVVDGDKNRDLMMKDVHLVFTKELNEAICPHPPLSPKESRSPIPEPKNEVSPGREPVTEIEQLIAIAPEEDRNPELPQCGLVLLLGGPCSGKSEVASRVCNQHLTWTHLDINEVIRSKVMNSLSPDHEVATCADNPAFVEDWTINIDVLKEALRAIPDDTEIIILEGFPKDSRQLIQFNTEIGRADFVILLDSEEDVMRGRMAERFCRIHCAEDDEVSSDLRIHHFKTNGLPVCRYYDENGKMCIVGGDRDILDVASDFENMINTKLEVINNSARIQQEDPMTQRDESIDDDLQHAAATKIQASIRGHLVRKQMNNNSSIAMENEDEEHDGGFDEHEKGEGEDMDEKDEDNEIMEADITVDQEETEETPEEGDEIPEQGDEIPEQGDEIPMQDVEKTEQDEEPLENPEEVLGKEEQVPENSEENPLNIEEKGNNENDVDKENEDESKEADVEEHIEASTEPLLGKNGVRTNSQMELMDAHVILLLGGPGSGKTTLGNQLVIKFAIPFINVNQIIRTAVESGHEERDQMQKYLVNEECDETVIYSLIRKSLMESLSTSKTMFVAGFPWTVQQYKTFCIDVCRVSATIFLDVDEETMKSRITSRDGSESDFNSTPQLELFQNNFPPLLDVLNENELFFKIDGTQQVEDVFQQVGEVVETFEFLKQEQ